MTTSPFQNLSSFAPITLTLLNQLVAHAVALPVYDTPEDPATPERRAAHEAQAVSLAAAALQQALCSAPEIDLTNDAVAGPVTMAAAAEFVSGAGDAVLAEMVRVQWVSREIATAGILRRPAGWLAGLVKSSTE